MSVFGSFSAMLRIADIPPNKMGRQLKWTHERIIEAMLDWLGKYGRWPRFMEWKTATEDHPHARTVALRFGSWNAAKRAAGWNGRQRHIDAKPVAA